jgi:hypothetical protein
VDVWQLGLLEVLTSNTEEEFSDKCKEYDNETK